MCTGYCPSGLVNDMHCISRWVCLCHHALLVEPAGASSLSCKVKTVQVMKLCAFYQNALVGVVLFAFYYVISVRCCVATVRGNS
jgi:hypothetical protein